MTGIINPTTLAEIENSTDTPKMQKTAPLSPPTDRNQMEMAEDIYVSILPDVLREMGDRDACCRETVTATLEQTARASLYAAKVFAREAETFGK